MDGATSFLTTKENLYFVTFDSTKNSLRLHMDMNFSFSSFGLVRAIVVEEADTMEVIEVDVRAEVVVEN